LNARDALWDHTTFSHDFTATARSADEQDYSLVNFFRQKTENAHKRATQLAPILFFPAPLVSQFKEFPLSHMMHF
jgi:hypothetical protein